MQAETLKAEIPAGLLTIDGDVVLFGDGVFKLEIGGDESCAYDAIDVTGRLVLGGTLNVSFMEDFTLGRCHEFVFARGEDVVGEFTEYPEGTLVGQVGTRDFFITYTAGDGNDAAIFSPVLLGDVNLDQRGPSVGLSETAFLQCFVWQRTIS